MLSTSGNPRILQSIRWVGRIARIGIAAAAVLFLVCLLHRHYGLNGRLTARITDFTKGHPYVQLIEKDRVSDGLVVLGEPIRIVLNPPRSFVTAVIQLKTANTAVQPLQVTAATASGKPSADQEFQVGTTPGTVLAEVPLTSIIPVHGQFVLTLKPTGSSVTVPIAIQEITVTFVGNAVTPTTLLNFFR